MPRLTQIALIISATGFMASCAAVPPPQPVALPPPPTPHWSASDFDCGTEPGAPPQDTQKAVAESYTADALTWGRCGNIKLHARGADAGRYGYVK